jgi:hypothetical protein
MLINWKLIINDTLKIFCKTNEKNKPKNF